LRGRAGDDADDVASETWIAAARSLRSFTGDGDAFRAWLFTIARNRLIDAQRKSSRAVPLGEAGSTPSPEDEVIAASAGEAAAQRIAKLLPADQADVILLRVIAGLSVDEVAAIIGKRPGTVRVLQSRGLKKLQNYL
jgi:RNA polymerase sigma-70 factor (ECF subfamily)